MLGMDSTYSQAEDPRLAISVHFNRIHIYGPLGVGEKNLINLLHQKTGLSSQQSTLATSIISIRKDHMSFEKMNDTLLDDILLHTSKEPQRIAHYNLAQSEFFSIDEVQSTLQIPKHTNKRSVQQLIRQVSFCEQSSTLRNQKPPHGNIHKILNWYEFVDLGGQSQFSQLLSAIVPTPCFPIFVPKLCDELNDYPIEGSTHVQLACTKKEILMYCVALEQTKSTGNHDIKLLMVGTFRDFEYQCSGETLDEKNKQLIKLLNPSIYDITLKNEGNKLIFPLNSNHPDDDEKIIQKIKNELLEMSQKGKPTDVQLRWLKLYAEISNNKSVHMIHINELIERAETFNIKDIDKFLNTFHEFHAIMYYPEVLPKVVFTSPQVLMDIFSQLVSVVTSNDMNPVIVAARDEGIISIALLNLVASRYPNCGIYKDNFFEPKDFINILLHLNIIFKCNGKSCDEAKYFMQTLLKELSRQDIARELSGCTDSTTTLILFSSTNGHSVIRYGEFCFIVTSLLLKNWKIAYNSENKPFCIFSNCIKLLAFGCAVMLVDRVSSYEIYITASNVELYQCIYSDIKESIIDEVTQIEIPCPCKENSSSHHHALFNENGTSVTCSHDTRRRYTLSSAGPNGIQWLETTGGLLWMSVAYCNWACD